MKTVLRLLKKLILQIAVILGVTFFSFLLIYLAPGDTATIIAESMGRPVSEEVLDAQREKMGLDQPFLVQYGNWLGDIAHGELGTSLVTKRPVAEELAEYLPRTLLLAVFTMVLTVAISVPLGIFTARRQGSVPDKVILGISYFLVSIPSFFLALLVLYFFGLKLAVFDIRSEGIVGIIMPLIVMTAGMCGWYIRQIRTIVLEQMKKDYVLGMRVRGIPEKTILYRHVLKNSLCPAITLLGMSFGGMLGGTAIVETIFSWKGVGFWAIDAISKRNFPVIQGYVLWMAVIFILVNFAVEVINTLIDPRLRRGAAG